MGSGVWAFAIGLHTFASVIFGYRLSNPTFLVVVALLWVFIYGTAIAGIAIHPDLFVRAVAWCWVNARYGKIRLWLHYFWIFIFEFGTVIVYSAMIFAVRVRVQTNFFSEQQAKQAKDAAKLMVAYPVIYVLCTLPLATLRMYSIRNPRSLITPGWFCFAGAMITSNGWADVLLYTLTRRIMLFSDEPPTCDNGIESFGTPWSTHPTFGTKTFCEHVPDTPDTELVYLADKPNQKGNVHDLLAFSKMKRTTTVEVKSEPMTDQERHAAQRIRDGSAVQGFEYMNADNDRDEAGSTRQLWIGNGSGEDVSRGLTPLSESYDMESLEFKTKPAGF
jgi:hypothetical protein